MTTTLTVDAVARSVPSAPVEVAILGPVVVTDAGVTIELRRGLPRSLLTWLALRAPEAVPADVLIERLWGDGPPSNPANALQIQVSYLRKALATGPSAATGVLVTRAGGYALDLAPEAIDAVRFERLVGAARDVVDAEPETGIALLEQALSLWRGDPLADLAGHPDAVGDHTRLVEMHLAAEELRVDALLSAGRHADAAVELRRLVAEHPLRERFHAQLMLALYKTGRQADALRAFEHARQLLGEQLGLDPGPELRRLESQILAHDPSLAPDARPPSASAAPPAAPIAHRRASLPAPVAPLVAREVELAHVLGLFERTRHVTLTGPGGAGKTRLAIEVASRAAAGQVLFVDLASADEHTLAATVAADLGLSVAPGDNAVAVIAGALADVEGLLVLDTCEHVLAEAAKVSEAVLQAAPAMRVLATSRRPLGLRGELAWPVPPLSVPAPGASDRRAVEAHGAVALFRERAEAVRPDFELTDANAADVAAICLALDGLPLAIELAAARLDVLSPASIRARLADRFSLLVSDAAQVADRQRTLRAAIESSIDLLDERERRFFAALGVFPAPFALDAAVAVTGATDDDAIASLRSLVRHSLVVVVGDERFRLLDSLRAYAIELSEELGSADEGRSRHASHFAAVAEAAERDVRGLDQTAAISLARAELPNFRAALDWSFDRGDRVVGVRLATALSWFWTLDGMFAEAVERLDAAIAAEVDDPRLQARALVNAALPALPLGELERARDTSLRAAEIARSVNMPGTLSVALVNVGVAEWGLGNLERAAAAHEEAIERSRHASNPWSFHMAMAMRARTALDAGDLGRARELLDELLPLVEERGDAQVLGLSLEQQARLALLEGRGDDARTTASRALSLHEAGGYREGIVSALHLLGVEAFERGRLDDAEAHHRQALDLAVAIGLSAGVTEALEALGELAIARDDLPRASRLLAAAAQRRATSSLPVRAADAPRIASLVAKVEPLPAVRADAVIDAELNAPPASGEGAAATPTA